MQGVPGQVLFPMVLDQLVDREALVHEARKDGSRQGPGRPEADGARRRTGRCRRALIAKEVGPLVTEQAVRARYDQDVAGKPGEEEVHARHILVPTEAEAKDIIAQLKKGADFAALAKQKSKDPGAAQGGDLGFFKKTDMVPEFADAAFALKPGQFSQTPVHTQFGWHVIKVDERKRDAPPTLRAGARRAAPEDDPGRRAEGARRGAQGLDDRAVQPWTARPCRRRSRRLLSPAPAQPPAK